MWVGKKTERQYTPIYFQDLCGQANVHSALVIKPEKFWDNKKAQLSTGTTKFEIQWIPYEQLVRFVDVTQIPKELGGAYPYNHSEWLQARIVSHYCHCYCQLFFRSWSVGSGRSSAFWRVSKSRGNSAKVTRPLVTSPLSKYVNILPVQDSFSV